MNKKEKSGTQGKASQILHPVLETMTRALNCTGWIMMKTPLVTEYLRLESIDFIDLPVEMQIACLDSEWMTD